MPRAAFVREERAWKKNLSVNTNKTQLPATFDRKFTMPSERAWVRVRQDGRDCLPRGWIGDGGHGSCAESQFDTSKIPSCGVPTLIVDSSYCHRRGERLSVFLGPALDVYIEEFTLISFQHMSSKRFGTSCEASSHGVL